MMLDLTNFGSVLKDLLVVMGAPIIRCVSGWSVKALADNRITVFEWRQLLQTIVRVGTIGLMAYFGLSIVGVENAAIASAVAAFFADKVFNALKQTRPVRQ